MLLPPALLSACGGTPAASSARDAATDVAIESPDAGDASPTDGATPPRDASSDADAAPLLHVDAGTLVLPQVLNFDGGVLVAPKLIAVTFPGDTEAAQIGTFTNAIGSSAYWAAVTSEYGVGAAIGAAIFETENAPAAIDQNAGDSETWLATRFDGTHLEWGTFDPSAVYLVFYPSTTVATPSVGGCGGAYHNAIPVTVASATDGGAAANAQLIYGIVFRCATSPDVGRPTGIDLTTYMASHEMVEATTDPFGTALLQTDDDHIAWAYFFGSEVADMCAFHAGAAITPSDVGFAVQRSWSNAAAAAFTDPCVPAESKPLFLAAPVPGGEEPISLSSSTGGSVATEGFSLPTGKSITIDVGFYGDAAGPWTVTPFTYTKEHGEPEPYLQFTPATLTGEAGDVVPLTITRLADDPDGNGGDAVKLVSAQGSATNEWYFAVSN